MTTVQPFNAIRYKISPKADLSSRICPPYDVLTQDDKDRLLAADPHNFVRIDLPHVPPKAAGPRHVYFEAANLFRTWLAEGVLEREQQPAIYPVAHTFPYAGKTLTRIGMFARVQIEEPGNSILPHEQTFSGPREDRRALFEATLANLSPVFFLATDSTGQLAQLLAQRATSAQQLADAQFDTGKLTLRRDEDPKIHQTIQAILQSEKLIIADGHHRYSTSLTYQNALKALSRSPLPAEHPANHVLAYIVSMADPGLLVLPTHRLIHTPPVAPDALQQLVGDRFQYVQLPPAASPDEVLANLQRLGPGFFGLYFPAQRTWAALKLRSPDLLRKLEPDRSQPWAELDLAALHRVLITDILQPAVLAGTEPTIDYIKDINHALQQAQQTGGLLAAMQPVSLPHLTRVCDSGDLMPQKSTYFYPKIPTGLLVYDLTPRGLPDQPPHQPPAADPVSA